MAAPQYETDEPVLYALADGIATLTLNRPQSAMRRTRR
jgi:hypothetical protein